MWKFVTLSLIAGTVTLYSAQSLITTSQTGSFTLPSENSSVTAPYDSLTDMRLEVRFTGLKECQSANPGNNIINFAGSGTLYKNFGPLSLGCTERGAKSLATYIAGPQIIATPGELGEHTDVIVRLQRNTTGVRYQTEVWAPDGELLASRTLASSFATGPVSMFPSQRFLVGNGTVQLAWLRWYSGIVPPGSPMPKDRGATPGDLANWEFDGTLSGTGSGGAPMAITLPASGCAGGNLSGCFTDSPVYPPVIQAKVTDAAAGGRMLLDGTQSFTYDDENLTDFRWEWVSGPDSPVLFDPRAASTTVGGLVAGNHLFRLKVIRSSGAIISKDVPVAVSNTDASGLPLFPVAAHQLTGAASVEFRAGDVAKATQVRITVRKPDGRLLPAVVCSTSPCDVPVDARQREHSYRLEFLDASGTVLLTLPWKPLPVQQRSALMAPNSGAFRKFGTYLAYNTPEKLGDPVLSAASGKFFSTRLHVGINGRNPRQWNPDMPMSLRYMDAVFSYVGEASVVREAAEANGLPMESFYAHYKVNHSYKVASIGWTGMDRFDAFSKSAGAYFDGIYTSDGLTFVDRSAAAYAGTTIPLTSTANTIYVGNSEPFDEVSIQFSKAGEGCSTAWEYWNGGGWAGISPRQTAGKLLFTPKPDWTRVALKSARSNAQPKWWLRMTVTNCSVYPVVSRIIGDDLTTGVRNAFGYPVYRGWCESSPTRINGGLSGDAGSLEYDPTPPPNCSARFRWQARMSGTWAPNMAVCNITSVQNGQYVCARLLAYESLRYLSSEGWNGVFLDDLYEPSFRDIAEPVVTTVAELISKTDIAQNEYYSSLETHYSKVGEYLREYDPSYKIGANTGSWRTARHGNVVLMEYGSTPWGAAFDPTANGARLGWDQFKPEVNPNGTIGMYDILDVTSELEKPDGMVWWDRGSRGPLTAYAQYLFYGNENTACFYTTSSVYFYGGRDDFYYWKETPEFRTSVPIASGTTAKLSYIEGDFTAFAQPRFSPVNISSIDNGVVRLAGPIPGLGSGQYVLIEGTSEPSHNQMVRVGVVNGNSFTSPDLKESSSGGTATRQPAPETLRIGEQGEYLSVWKVDNTRVATAERIWNDYDSRTGLYRIYTGHLSTDPLPPVNQISRWGYWTPAFEIDPGIPDTAKGIVGDDGQKGSRKTVWKTRAESGTRNGISARSFTSALVLWASGWIATAREYQAYSNEIQLDGIYYPLRVDGTSGPGVSSIRLRTGEGAILMYEPIP